MQNTLFLFLGIAETPVWHRQKGILRYLLLFYCTIRNEPLSLQTYCYTQKTIIIFDMKKNILFLLLLCMPAAFMGQTNRSRLAQLPPMGWMSWNLLKDGINETNLREMADAMVAEGLADAGYRYLFIDDMWQGGRDKFNNIIPDPQKFPNGIKALADYVHSKGLKLGIYSDAAQLTCGGCTGSYGFELQDARTFAAWGIDYLKYDYCNAPEDEATAKARYKAMADALSQSGRDMVLGVCEWGVRHPARWAYEAGGQLWRTTYDIRDMWTDTVHQGGMGIMDIVNQTADLHAFAGPGRWNDMDMLVVGLYGKGGPSSDLGGKGCTDTEYETQMSLWCMMGSPLALSNDLRTMNAETKRIILNKDIIAINQDALGKVAVPVIRTEGYQVYLRPLTGNRWAIAIVNTADTVQRLAVDFKHIGLKGSYSLYDVWLHKTVGKNTKWSGKVQPHQTKVFILSA